MIDEWSDDGTVFLHKLSIEVTEKSLICPDGFHLPIIPEDSMGAVRVTKELDG